MAALASHPAGTFNAPRQLGRFQLQRSLGVSARTLLWLATDPRDGRALVLAMPRRQPADADGLQRWLAAAHHVARIKHPGLACVLMTVARPSQWLIGSVAKACHWPS